MPPQLRPRTSVSAPCRTTPFLMMAPTTWLSSFASCSWYYLACVCQSPPLRCLAPPTLPLALAAVGRGGNADGNGITAHNEWVKLGSSGEGSPLPPPWMITPLPGLSSPPPVRANNRGVATLALTGGGEDTPGRGGDHPSLFEQPRRGKTRQWNPTRPH